jgi:hypothetical protein
LGGAQGLHKLHPSPSLNLVEIVMKPASNLPTLPWKSLVAALSLAIASPLLRAEPASTETRLATVTTTARLPVRLACPDVDQELPDELVQAWNEVGLPGVVRVEFKLQGRRIVEVNPLTGPQRYFRHVRKAVRSLDCRAPDGAPHVVQMNIRFVDMAGGDGATATAGLAVDDRALQ